MTQGGRLQRWRKFRGFSRQALADKCGVTRQTVLGWETDKWEPSDENLVKLCEVLGLPAPPKQTAAIPDPPAISRGAA